MYILSRGANQAISVISNRVTSFWTRLIFTVQPNGLVALQTAHFAVYLTYSHTDVDNGDLPQAIPFPGEGGETGDLQISRAGVNETLLVRRTRLLRKMAIRRSNEVGILLLFDINNLRAVNQAWIDSAAWAPTVPDPKANADGTRFAPSHATFGTFQDRFVHEVALTTDNQGVSELVLVVNMQQQPMIGQITEAATAGRTFPTLSLRALGGDPTPFFAPNSIEVPVRGCVTAAVGAFAQMDADLLLRAWVSDSADLARSLSELIWAPHNVATGENGRLVRKLSNVNSTAGSDNSLFGDASVVREALYMKADTGDLSFHPDPGFI